MPIVKNVRPGSATNSIDLIHHQALCPYHDSAPVAHSYKYLGDIRQAQALPATMILPVPIQGPLVGLARSPVWPNATSCHAPALRSGGFEGCLSI